MKLLSQITVQRNQNNATIQLLHGDLTAIPQEHAADILVVSAYPGSYEPIRDTLMAALYHKGIVIGEMAKNKAIDLRKQLGCWLSKPLSEEQQKQFNFQRILCFEPGNELHDDNTVVSNIFRCINTFAFEKQNNVIALPVVASGNQKVSLDKMLPAIVETAIFWLENGLPLKSVKLVLYSVKQVEVALPLFEKIKQKYKNLTSPKEKVTFQPRTRKKIVKNSAILRTRGLDNSKKEEGFLSEEIDEFDWSETEFLKTKISSDSVKKKKG